MTRLENRSRTIAAALVAALALLPGAEPARAGYSALETEHLRLIYRDELHEHLAPHVARCFENAMRFYGDVFDYVPSEKITVLLDDAYDFNNAAALATPRNTLLVQIAPASFVYETLPSNERINHTMNHELAHIMALDQTAGPDRFFRRLFQGKVSTTPEHPETILYEYLTHPRFAAPRWYHEGLAVFLETWMAGGIGRAQGAYDEMVFRAMVQDGSRFYDPVGLESEGTKVDFQVGAKSYLYGTRFLTYMAQTTSPDSFVRWVSRRDGTRGHYAAQFRRMFGTSIEAAWRDWIRWEQDFQRANLDSLRRHPQTPYRDLSREALGSISRPFLDRERNILYAGLRPAGAFGHLAAIDLATGGARPLCEVKGPALYYVTSLARDPASGALFYTADNNDWRDLWTLQPDGGRPQRLQRDVRIGDLVFDRTDAGLWGVRHFNGISTLVRIPPPYTSWKQVHSWPYGQDLYDLDVSPDGRQLVFGLAEISGRQTLRLADTAALLRGDGTSREIYDFGASIPCNFVFDPTGRYLYGSSYYTGVSNIWRYDLAADSMHVVTNGDTGFFRPLPLGNDSLLVFRYTGEGFVPALVHAMPLEDVSAIAFLGQQVAERHPVVQGWNAGSPARIDLDAATRSHGPYRSLRALGLESIVPVVEGYKDDAAVGVHFAVSDPGFSNHVAVTLTATPTGRLPDDERLHARLRARRRGFTATFRHDAADFYDLFGPTKTSRRGTSLGLQYERRFVADKPKRLDLEMSATGYTRLERLPEAQNVSASFDKLLASSASLRFANVRRSLGAVDDEKGLAWEVAVRNRIVNRRAFPALQLGLDAGVPLPLRHASLWWRNAAGIAPADRDEPFSNFYFGGFGNNWVDHRDEKRYREPDAFPGVEINDVAGTNFAKSMLEWNLPPVRFRRFGRPGLYLTWARPALFATGLVTNVDAAAHRRSLASVGVQVDLRLSLLARLSMTLSGGYAAAFERDRGPRDEILVSLKVL